MNKFKLSMICFLLICLIISPALAQNDVPIVGILKPGPLRPLDLAEQGILDMFEAYGYENGENIEIRQVDASGDVTLLKSDVEVLVSEGVDILMPIGAASISATLSITSELENPPAVIFAVAQNLYTLGFAEDACTKPDYFTGQSSGQSSVAYTRLFESIRELDPELNSIAYVYNSNDPGAVAGAAVIETVSEEFDFNLISEPVSSGEEVVPVIESLLIAGAESILVADVTAGAYLAPLSELSIQAAVPIFTIDAGAIYLGTTMGVGSNFYQMGVNAGRIAVNYLDGEIDLATTGISEGISLIRAFNVDIAAEQNVSIPNGFLDDLDFYIENGESTEVELSLPDISLDELRALDAEFLAGLQCPRPIEATEEADS